MHKLTSNKVNYLMQIALTLFIFKLGISLFNRMPGRLKYIQMRA